MEFVQNQQNGPINPPAQELNPPQFNQQPQFNPPPPFNPPQGELPLPVEKITGDATLDKMLADLGSKNFFARQKAVAYLSNLAPNAHRPAVAQKLAALCQNPDTQIRNTAVQLLPAWATPKEVPALIQLLSDKDINTRNQVLKNIGKLRDPRTVKPVVDCFLEFQTRYHAERTLKEMGPMAEKEVLAILMKQGKDPLLKGNVIRILKEIGTQQSVPALQAIAMNEFIHRNPAQQALTAIAARSQK